MQCSDSPSQGMRTRTHVKQILCDSETRIPNLTKFQPHPIISKFPLVSMVPTDLMTRFCVSTQIFIYSEGFYILLNFLFCSHIKICVDSIQLPSVFSPPLVNRLTCRTHLRTHPVDWADKCMYQIWSKSVLRYGPYRVSRQTDRQSGYISPDSG